jgi:transmembrane sensor
MADSKQIEQAAATWLAQRSAEPVSSQDQQAFEAWLNASSAHRVAFLRLQSGWRQADRLKALAAGFGPGQVPARGQWSFSAFELRESTSATSIAKAAPLEFDTDADAESTAAPLRRLAMPEEVYASAADARHHPARKVLNRFAGMAAVLMLGVSIAVTWQWYGAVEQARYQTSVGQLQNVQLADGSSLTLSSDSQILVTLSRQQRLVELVQGEAIFQVAKDAERPFVVDAHGSRVTAVGTRFSVRQSVDGVRVVVTEGTVKLQPEGAPEPSGQVESLLHAGGVAMLDRNGVSIRADSSVEVARLLDWQGGHLSFRDATLALAAVEFNQFNRRKLRMGDDQVAAMRVGGHFRWSNVEAFVRLLEQGFPVRAEYRADEIVLYSAD